MIVNQKIKIVLKDEDALKLDEQSQKCSRMYNKLLEYYYNKYGKDSRLKYVDIKEIVAEHDRLINEDSQFNNVNPSPLLSTCFRVKEAVERYKKGLTNAPAYKSNKIKWFSLFYSLKSNSIFFNGNKVAIYLNDNRDYIIATLKEEINPNNRIIHYRITKELDKYFISICMDRDFEPSPKTGKSIAIDPNHENFFVGIDSDGQSIKFENLKLIKFFNKQIDSIMKKRGKCKVEKKINENGIPYTVFSRNYLKLNKVLKRVTGKRNSQLKTALYTIANYLADLYDIIAIGDYTPDLTVASKKNMHRPMLNDTVIGQFRTILEHVCNKKGKTFIKVNEEFTTTACACCGFMDKKNPNIRIFKCPCCNKTISRDINSAINIGVKAKLFKPYSFNSLNLESATKNLYYNIFTGKIVDLK